MDRRSFLISALAGASAGVATRITPPNAKPFTAQRFEQPRPFTIITVDSSATDAEVDDLRRQIEDVLGKGQAIVTHVPITVSAIHPVEAPSVLVVCAEPLGQEGLDDLREEIQDVLGEGTPTIVANFDITCTELDIDELRMLRDELDQSIRALENGEPLA